MTMLHATQNCATEWAYTSARNYADPFNDIQLDVIITQPDGSTQTVPAFWGGDEVWRVRYAASQTGTHQFRTVCSDTGNAGLHDQTGTLEVEPYTGTNPLLQHGPLRVAADQRHLEHRDGTPFFWLADTWWMALCKRLQWPAEFQELTADRVNKGFSVIQIVAGLYPDMKPFDPRGANEAGFPWAEDFSTINPAYFDAADQRIAHLVRSGLVPCIVGFWGYFLDVAGIEVLKKHWRYLIARYSAYPVVWCAAGEALMPYYLSEDFQRMIASKEPWRPADRRATWSDLLRYIRATDPGHHPLTIHPVQFGQDQVDDPSLMDFEWLQTGHGSHRSQAATVNMVEDALAHETKMPVMVSEVNYEGILEGSREEIQRFHFWTCLLSGAAGHTYGANGIWQVNRVGAPFGPSPHGLAWGNRPWNEAYKLPGSGQLGLAKRILERYEWWRFESHPEWVEPHHDRENQLAPYAAGIPGEVRVLFMPIEALRMKPSEQPIVQGLEPGVKYRAFHIDPSTGDEYPAGLITGDAEGKYQLPQAVIFRDWVFVLEKAS